MTLRPVLVFSLFTYLGLPVLLSAQNETTEPSEATEATATDADNIDRMIRRGSQWYRPKYKLNVGIRILTSGGRVDFQNLGTVPSPALPAPAADGVVLRAYNNGAVSPDGVGPTERDEDGNQTSTPGGRYDVFTTATVPIFDEDGNITGTEEVTYQSGDYLAYTPGLTREWAVNSESQFATPGYVSFNTYSTTSDGATLSNKQGATGGIELQLIREIGTGSRHMQWGVLAGVTLNDINSKVAGTVNATLHNYADYFSLNGLTADPANLENPSFTELLDSDGVVLNPAGYETTVVISSVPDAALHTNTATAGGAGVSGNWQVKGAYFLFKVGPSLRTQLTNRLGLTASLGFAGAYAGTRYSAYESFTIEDMPGVVLDTTEESITSKFLTGYFADVNLEWTANERMGLFGGFAAQQLGNYDQPLGGRNARIDLGSSVGIRGGVSIRF